MTDKELMQQALEALTAYDGTNGASQRKRVLTALREWLAQPEQEPVAYYLPHKGFYWAKPTRISAPTIADVEPLPLYTTPPKETK